MYTGAQVFDTTGAVAPLRRGALGNESLGGRLRWGAVRKASLSERMRQGATHRAPLCVPFMRRTPSNAVAGLNVRRTPWI